MALPGSAGAGGEAHLWVMHGLRHSLALLVLRFVSAYMRDIWAITALSTIVCTFLSQVQQAPFHRAKLGTLAPILLTTVGKWLLATFLCQNDSPGRKLPCSRPYNDGIWAGGGGSVFRPVGMVIR